MSQNASLSSAPQQFPLFEILEIVLLAGMLVIAGGLLYRCLKRQAASPDTDAVHWRAMPEVQLAMLALPLHLLWELAQFPLYILWHEGSWGEILYALVHCTLGDILILLSVFWLVSLLNRSRQWVYARHVLLNALVFTALGLGYTVYSEIVNTRVVQSWAYTELMPIVPLVEVGGTPFMQWLLISPLLVWLMRLTRSAMVQAARVG